MAPLALALALVAAGPGTVTVEVEAPTTNLARLEPFLTWAGMALPALRPERIRRAVKPLGLDPFTADAAAWRAAGLDPKGRVHAVYGRGGGAVAVPIGDRAALRAHLTPRTRTATTGRHRGFVAGRPGRPTLIGLEDEGRVWLQRHHTLFPMPKRQRAAGRRGLVRGLAAQVDGFDPPPRIRGPKPHARLGGHGPAPFADWRGGVWVEPERFSGELMLTPGEHHRDRIEAWTGRRRPRRLLAPRDDLVVELCVRAKPTALDAELRLPSRGPWTGEMHAALTADGGVVVALALRPKTSTNAVRTVTSALIDRWPGLAWSRSSGPDRLVVWFAGADEPALSRWAKRAPRGRAPGPLWASVRPSRILAAIRARDAAAAGPTLGTGQSTLLGVAYGRFLRRTGDITVTVRRPSRDLFASWSITR